MLQYFRLVVLALLLSVGVGTVGTAASFDCNKATTETEIAICNDPELSALDELMSSLYQLKYSINLSSEDLSFETDTFDFPAFERTALRDNQFRWIEEVQTNCFGLSACLTEAYLTRLGDFYGLHKHSRASQDFGWTIERRLVLSEIGQTVIVWVHDTNETEDYGCFSETYHPISYIITVHRTSDWRLIDYNASLLPHMDDSCLMLEYDLSELGDHSLELNTSFMRSAGGWGAGGETFTFKINEDEIILKKYSKLYYARNVHLFETTVLDFENKLLKIEYDNGSEEVQTVRGKNIDPGENFEHVLHVDNLPELSFNHTNISLMYDLIERAE